MCLIGAQAIMQGLQGQLQFSSYANAHSDNVSSGSRYSSDDDESDDGLPSDLRGRAFSEKGLQNSENSKYTTSTRRPSPRGNSSGDSAATATGRTPSTKKRTFTRSRSPAVLRVPTNIKSLHRHLSPTVHRNPRKIFGPRHLLAADFRFLLRFPFSSLTWTFSIDARKLGESLVLLCSLLLAAYHITTFPTPKVLFIANSDTHLWLAFGDYPLLLFIGALG